MPNPAPARSALRQRCTSYAQPHCLTLFCDFDGPIVDVSDRYYSTYQRGLAEMCAADVEPDQPSPVCVLSKQQFWQMKQERTPDPEIALRSGLRGEQIARFLDRVKQIVNCPDLLEQDRLQTGVPWSLAWLHGQGVRLILVTLRQPIQVTQILQQHGLAHLFTAIYGAEDEMAAYANQAEHKTTLLATAVREWCPTIATGRPDTTTTAWMIGDTEADVLAGQAVGIPTIALSCGIRSHSYLQRFAPTQLCADLLAAAQLLMSAKPLAA